MAVLTSIFIVMFVTHVLHFYNSCIERYGPCIECTKFSTHICTRILEVQIYTATAVESGMNVWMNVLHVSQQPSIERYGRTCIDCTRVPMNVPGYSRYRSTLLVLQLIFIIQLYLDLGIGTLICNRNCTMSFIFFCPCDGGAGQCYQYSCRERDERMDERTTCITKFSTQVQPYYGRSATAQYMRMQQLHTVYLYQYVLVYRGVSILSSTFKIDIQKTYEID